MEECSNHETEYLFHSLVWSEYLATALAFPFSVAYFPISHRNLGEYCLYDPLLDGEGEFPLSKSSLVFIKVRAWWNQNFFLCKISE